MHPWPNDGGVGWLCCPGIVWESIRETSLRATVKEHSATVVSARWATVDRYWRKEWNSCARADLHLNNRKNIGEEWIAEPCPKNPRREEKATTPSQPVSGAGCIKATHNTKTSNGYLKAFRTLSSFHGRNTQLLGWKYFVAITAASEIFPR